MHIRDKKMNALQLVKIKIWYIFAVIIIFLLMRTNEASADTSWGYPYEDHKGDDIGSTERNNIIYFENDKVEAGVTLNVLGAPEGSTYNWTITSADGTKTMVTTKDNFYVPLDSDIEKLITVTVEGLEGAEAAIYFSELPVVYINNTTGYYNVNDLFCDAVMSMQGNVRYSNSDELYHGNIKIKLRGNSTKEREKRPFNIKLANKSSLLGMGENKHWALLANDIDHTLLRNKLLYDFSGAIGMDTYMKSENVVVIFNNNYYGVYQLCEIVNVGSDRVNIYDWEECAEDAAQAIVERYAENGDFKIEDTNKAEKYLKDAMCLDLSWITSPYTFSYDINRDDIAETIQISDYIELPAATGGVLVELDSFAYRYLYKSTMITAYIQPLYCKTPEYTSTNNNLFGYTQKYLQAFEYALHSTDFIYHESDKKYKFQNEYVGFKTPEYKDNAFKAPEYDGKHYSELFDMDSLVQNFLVVEYSMNFDSMRGSLYMYKDIDDLFHLGPVWDFDWALGNINMFKFNVWYPTLWQTTAKELDFRTTQWNRCLIRDPYFITQVYQKYKAIRETVIEDMIKSGGDIDTYEEYLKNAAVANDAKWDYTYEQYKSVGFDESLINMKSFINTRVNWFDEQFQTLDTLMTSLGYYKPNAELMVSKVNTNSLVGYTEATAIVTNPEISYITYQVNGTHMYTSEVVDGQAVCYIPNSDLVSEADQLNVIQIIAKNSAGEYIIDNKEECNYYNAKSNYAVFYKNRGFVNLNAVKIKDLEAETTIEEGSSPEEDSASMEASEEVSQEVSVQQPDQSDSHIILIILLAVLGLSLIGLAGVIIIKISKRK